MTHTKIEDPSTFSYQNDYPGSEQLIQPHTKEKPSVAQLSALAMQLTLHELSKLASPGNRRKTLRGLGVASGLLSVAFAAGRFSAPTNEQAPTQPVVSVGEVAAPNVQPSTAIETDATSLETLTPQERKEIDRAAKTAALHSLDGYRAMRKEERKPFDPSGTLTITSRDNNNSFEGSILSNDPLTGGGKTRHRDSSYFTRSLSPEGTVVTFEITGRSYDTDKKSKILDRTSTSQSTTLVFSNPNTTDLKTTFTAQEAEELINSKNTHLTQVEGFYYSPDDGDSHTVKISPEGTLSTGSLSGDTEAQKTLSNTITQFDNKATD